MILADQHLHSAHSADSETPMEVQIEAGIEAGLRYMCFTEHMDKDWPEVKDCGVLFELDTDAYYKHYLECRERYKDRVELRFGVEYGFQRHLVQHNTEYVGSHPFDMVIGSQHLVDGVDVYLPEYFEGMDEKQAYGKYFEALLESICLFDGYDICGHLDYVVRYGPNKNKFYNYGDYREVVDEILKQLIQRGKGIEVNTAGFRKLGDETNPCTDILKRYRELGGEIITIGSDAHVKTSVAYDFGRAGTMLKELGYEYYCLFKNRFPEFVDL